MPGTDAKIEDGRAHHALQAAQKARKRGESVADDYQSYAKNLPMRIKTNGLGAALAFIRAKDAEAYDLLHDDIESWLHTDQREYLLAGAEGDSLVEQVVSLDSTAYRAATREVLSYLSWLRRFAEGQIDSSG
ncbi:type III-B CRISPR module-associated protein Cmr5 [Salinibacter sp.]|uniref:type III-B CRISPR module-associated protein Cmr5 n=1 Tax=Salinibacter sp. TaxID=2065818 RepID=UPI0021E92041|nr:type III-B CRISPR module-associated protein Cmr5 [Salinibacter sp.]